MTTENKRIFAGAWLVAAIAIFIPTPARAELSVITTTTDLADLARAIGGDHVEVEAICAGEQDPHYVQARPSYMVKLNRADLVIAVGLELEVGWLPSLLAGARNPDVNPGKRGYLDASSAIKPIDVPAGKIDRSQGDVHPLGNPHYWLDPDNARRVAELIAKRLAELDGDHAADYQKGLQRFSETLAAAERRWDQKLGPLRGTKLVTYHATFNYFLKRYGLSAIGYVEPLPGIPPAPAHLARLVLDTRAQGVKVILHELYHERAASDLVAGRSGAKVLALPTSVGGAPGTDHYIALMDHLVDRVAGSLQAK